jgi:hypothetical protein
MPVMNGDPLLAGEVDERCLERVVDEVEDEAGVEVLGFEDGRGLVAGHADGGGVDDDVEGGLGEGVLLDGLGAGLAGELLRGLGGAVEDEDFGAAVAQAEDGGAGGPAGPEDEDLGATEGDALFERADDAGDVGVEAVELAVEQADGVDGADLGGERVGLLEVGRISCLSGMVMERPWMGISWTSLSRSERRAVCSAR